MACHAPPVVHEQRHPDATGVRGRRFLREQNIMDYSLLLGIHKGMYDTDEAGVREASGLPQEVGFTACTACPPPARLASRSWRRALLTP